MIDAHFHLWELARNDYGWITPDLPPLYRDFSFTDLQQALADSPVEKFILVQCAETEAETEYLLGIAQATTAIAGVVGWTDFEASNAKERIKQLSQRSKLVGLRPMIQGIADPEWMLKPMLAPAFEAMIENNLCFDALVLPQHLTPLLTLLKRYPELHIVIDHAAKPFIAKGETEPWRSQMLEIAATTNTFCKFSGLVTEAGQDWDISTLKPFVKNLIAAFGTERLMWGSDWPVVNMASNYQNWLRCAETLTETLDIEAKQKLFGLNAERFYRLQ